MKIINKVFLILLVSLAASCLFAQSTIDTFVQKVEGAGELTAAVQAADGSYVMVSRIESASFIVRRIKLSGQKQWERRLNFDLDWDSARILGIAQTTDGGFVLAGYAGCESEFDCVRTLINGATLIKLRANGTVAWKRITASGFAYFFASVIPMPDGGVIAIGGRFTGASQRTTSQPQLIVRVTSAGDVVWKKQLTTPPVASFGSYPFPLVSSTATPDNGFIIAFPTSTNLNNRPPNGVDVMKITNSGNIVWEKSLKADDFVFKSMGLTAEGGVILIGAGTDSNKLKVVVLKGDGKLSWKAEYSFQVGRFPSISSPVQTLDGGYVISGSNGFIAKIDSSRKVVFQNTLGNGLAGGSSVFATPDGGFFLFGAASTESDILVLKVNSEGIVPGCEFFASSGRATSASFGLLRIAGVKITTSDDLSLEPLDLGLSSVVTNHSVSSVCQ